MGADQVSDLLNRECGPLWAVGISADMRELLALVPQGRSAPSRSS
jgi:hypothetical protein